MAANRDINDPDVILDENSDETFNDLESFKKFFKKQESCINTSDLMYSVPIIPKWPLVLFDMSYNSGGVVVAGSAAIHKLAEFLEVKINWKTNDTDIFFLGSPKMGRCRANDCDIIASKFGGVEELLNSFDLPCSRVAYDDRYIFFTQQAIKAILYGEYWLADMVTDEKKYCKALTEIPRSHLKHEFFTKTQARIVKYSERGMKPILFESKTVPDFLSVRKAYSHYAGDSPICNRPTLLTEFHNAPISRRLLYSLVKHERSDIIARMTFDPQLREYLEFVLSPRHPLLQETMAIHQITLDQMKGMLDKPIHNEKEFRETMRTHIVKLERLFMAQKI